MSNIGIVLSGGGARGAYQVGAWVALKELGIAQNINCLAGSSVGALNAALFTQDHDEKLLEFWLEAAKVFQTQENQDINYKANRLASILANTLDFELLKQKDVYVTITRMPDGMDPVSSKAMLGFAYIMGQPMPGTSEIVNLRHFDNSQIIKYLLASSALPIILPHQEIDGKIYFDGGIKNNLPFEPLLGAGIEEAIVIGLGEKKEVTGFKSIVRIEPIEALGSSVNFEEGLIRRYYNLGYIETKAKYEKSANF